MAALGALVAVVLGAAPHVLHHVGPFAGTALLAGTSGRLLFGALGFLLTISMLRRLHRRSGGWRVPGGVLALMMAIFAFSSFVIGPALAGDPSAATPGTTITSPEDHEQHHP